MSAGVRVVSDAYVLVLAGTLLAAVGQPFVVNAVTPIAAGYLDERDRPRGIALMSASLFAGMLVAFALGAVLSRSSRMPTLVAIQAALAVVAAGALVVALRARRVHRIERAPAGVGAFRVAWGTTLVRRLCVFLFLPYGVFITISTWTEALLEPAGVSDVQVGLMLALQVVAGIAGAALLPVWVARRRIELRFAVGAMLVSAGACLALAVAPGFITGMIVLPALGFVALVVLPVVLELTERGSEQAEGTASGLIWLAGNLGGLIVASIIGVTVDAPAASFVLLAASVLATLPLVRRLREPVGELPPIPGLGAELAATCALSFRSLRGDEQRATIAFRPATASRSHAQVQHAAARECRSNSRRRGSRRCGHQVVRHRKGRQRRVGDERQDDQRDVRRGEDRRQGVCAYACGPEGLHVQGEVHGHDERGSDVQPHRSEGHVQGRLDRLDAVAGGAGPADCRWQLTYSLISTVCVIDCA